MNFGLKTPRGFRDPGPGVVLFVSVLMLGLFCVGGLMMGGVEWWVAGWKVDPLIEDVFSIEKTFGIFQV